MGRFYVGQIVQAYVSNGQGQTKPRPVLIISVGDPRIPDDDLRILAITGSIEDPCPAYHVRVEPSAVGCLTKPSVIKCNWTIELSPHKVSHSLGALPDELLDLVLSEYQKLLDNYDFLGWMPN